jgi:trimeric autotransporter adhesin
MGLRGFSLNQSIESIMKTKQVLLLALLALCALNSALPTASAQGTAFTYQGQLSASGSPANNNYDFTFALFNNSSTNTGQQIGTTQTNLDVGVTNGLFIVTLNFGDVFTGTNYWLAIGVRTNGGSTFTALNPLQEVTPTPYAIYAPNAGSAATATTAGTANAVAAANITGTILPAQLSATVVTNNETGVTLGGTFTGNGANLTNLNASQLASGANTNLFVGPSGNSATTGSFNTAVGVSALQGNTTGNDNTAYGFNALQDNTNGSRNTAYGTFALQDNTAGNDNTAVGTFALEFITNGSFNTAVGEFALGGNPGNTTGSENTATGWEALTYNMTGNDNTGDGFNALAQLGYTNDAGGTNNIALGHLAGYNYTGNESSNIDIGNAGVVGENNTIHIGTQGVQTTATIAGNVGIGTNSPGELLEVAGANATIRVRNQNDPVGGFIGDTYYALQLGMYNATNITEGVLSVGEKRSFFGCAYQTGQVGSLSSDYGSPSFRNVLDDGSGNLTVAGKVGIGSGTSTPTYPLQMASGAYCSAAGVWTSVSDRNVKEDFTSIKPAEVLAKVAALPITQWKYKVEPNGIKHLGPVAQDFYSSFGLGDNDKAIGTVDESGVALAAIQGLNQKLNEKDAEIEKLKAKADKVDSLEKQNISLAQRLNELEAAVQLLAERK